MLNISPIIRGYIPILKLARSIILIVLINAPIKEAFKASFGLSIEDNALDRGPSKLNNINTGAKTFIYIIPS